MDNEQLLTFMTVFELNNYSRAADYLNLTQPAITARIQKLEIELGCKLFYREGKKILLTKEGEALLPFAQKILEYMNEAKQTIEQMKTPTLTIGLSPAISVSIVMQALSLLQEKDVLEFDLVEAEDSGVVSKLVEDGLVDIGLVRDIIPFTNLLSQIICHEKLFFIVGKEHPFAIKDVINKEDLIDQTMICYRRETALWKKIDGKLVGIKNFKRIEVGGFEMVLSMVKNNWGFSIVPELILCNDKKQDFSIIPFPEFDDLSYNIRGIYKEESPRLKELLLFQNLFETALTNY